MDDIDLALYTGVDIPLPECQLIIHQPTVKEISMVGEKQFLFGVQNLCIDKDRLADGDKVDLSNISNFQIFMMIMQEKEAKENKENVKTALSLIIPNAKVTFTPNSLLLIADGKNSVIDESNFDIFQGTLRQVFCMTNAQEEYNIDKNDKRAVQIKEKLEKRKKQLAEIHHDNEGSLYARRLSILAVGLKIPPDVLINYTVYQINDLSERYNLWLNWDLEIRSRLAGAKGDDKPED